VTVGGRPPGLDPGVLEAQAGQAIPEGPAHVLGAVVGQRPLEADAEVAVVAVYCQTLPTPLRRPT
jgi:hypothetical protein